MVTMADGHHTDTPRHRSILRSEASMLVGFLATAIFWTFGGDWLTPPIAPAAAALSFTVLFSVMLWLSFTVVHHAECLAVRLGEPYGTLVLTLSVISIEVVMISAVMITGGENPTLARDTMFSVLMIVLNGILGTTLLLGGLRHRELEYNLEGARSYLAVIFVLAILCLVLPRFTTSAPGGAVSPLMAFFLIAVSVGLYAIFLHLQTTTHRGFFKHPGEAREEHHGPPPRSIGYHSVFLILGILPIVLLSKKIAVAIDFGIGVVGAPQALAGFVVAMLVLAPEGLAAANAALANTLQRTVNIALGSALATIGLTVPAVLLIAATTGKFVELGLEPTEIVLLVATFLCASVVFGGTRTNTLAGAVHLVIFLAYIVLVFD
jgi:Ca2+:H+ antiporter